MWSRLGAKVTVVEFLDKIVPNMVSSRASLQMTDLCKDKGLCATHLNFSQVQFTFISAHARYSQWTLACRTVRSGKLFRGR